MDQAIHFPPPPFSPGGSSKGAEGSEGLPEIPTPPASRQRPVELGLVLRLVFLLKPEDSELHFLSREDPIMVSRPTSPWQAKYIQYMLTLRGQEVTLLHEIINIVGQLACPN